MLSTFEDVFVHAPLGMAIVALSGTPLRVNDALCQLTGYSSEQILTRPFHELCDPRDTDLDAAHLTDLLAGTLPSYQIEKRFLHARGYRIWVLLHASLMRDDHRQPLHLLLQVEDISARKALEGRLEELVDRDFLTTLFNRRHFELSLAMELRSAARYGGGGAVLLLDLDRFKEVNDRFGHNAGDDLLKRVAAALKARMRETDVIARLGGDEFGVILPRVDRAQAELVAGGVVKAMRRLTASLAGEHIRMTASVGVAMFGDWNVTALMAAADLAMYSAKEAGRDRYAFYRSPPVDQVARASRFADAERIQQAIATNRLELYCQPILDLATGEVSQHELLVRLRTEQGELLRPADFLYVAERFGSIIDIDAWVVRQAVRIIAAKARTGCAVSLNVNIAATSLGPQLVSVVDEALATSKINPACLVFEITETTAIGNVEHAKTFTSELQARGCRFALDDFGTGFGSFYYLKHLPFDYFKIDGDFVGSYSASTTDQLVVDAIVGIAKGMAKKTVAEFVTDEDVMERLRRSGVDYAQGFHIGLPAPVADVFGL